MDLPLPTAGDGPGGPKAARTGVAVWPGQLCPKRKPLVRPHRHLHVLRVPRWSESLWKEEEGDLETLEVGTVGACQGLVENGRGGNMWVSFRLVHAFHRGQVPPCKTKEVQAEEGAHGRVGLLETVGVALAGKEGSCGTTPWGPTLRGPQKRPGNLPPPNQCFSILAMLRWWTPTPRIPRQGGQGLNARFRTGRRDTFAFPTARCGKGQDGRGGFKRGTDASMPVLCHL